MPHIIRLRGPWEFLTQADATPHKTGRIELPGDLQSLVAQYAGEVRFRRRFHRPSGLSGATRVELVIAGLPLHAQVVLNRQPLEASPAPRRHEIAALLADHNELEIALNIAIGEPLAADVWLEISEPA